MTDQHRGAAQCVGLVLQAKCTLCTLCSVCSIAGGKIGRGERVVINISREMVNIIRSEDYEAEAGSGSMRGALEMKRGLLRQATKTEEEQVSCCKDNNYV